MDIDKSGTENSLVCIEYPGVVRNVDKMMETLGGELEISKVFSKKNRRLELRFRPQDIFCKPACGDRSKTNAFLLKVKMLVKKKPPECSEDDESCVESVKSCEILGKVDTVYKFKSMCDFQFLPMLLNASGKMEDIRESLLPSRFDGDYLKKWLNSPADIFLPPAAFSRVDSVSQNSYMYRRDKAVDGDDGPLIGRTRKRRSGHTLFLSFDAESVPSKPRDKALKLLDVKFLNGRHIELMRKCFDERPVWSKLGLMCVTGFTHEHLKYLLPSVAYYFVTGPFRIMWIRFGYDPRKDPQARIYQTLDYRIRAPAGLMSLVKSKRNSAAYILPMKSHPSAKAVILDKRPILEDREEQPLTEQQGTLKKYSHILTPETIPPARQMFYQYCDVKIPEIEAMLGRLPKVSPNATCDPKHGWLPPGFDSQCRTIINKLVLELLKKENAARLGNTSEDQEEDEVDADDSSDGDELGLREEFDDDDIDAA